MKKLSCLLAVLLSVCLAASSAMACTAIYVGSDLTEDGTAFFARSEDYANSRNKVMYVSPAVVAVAIKLHGVSSQSVDAGETVLYLCSGVKKNLCSLDHISVISRGGQCP